MLPTIWMVHVSTFRRDPGLGTPELYVGRLSLVRRIAPLPVDHPLLDSNAGERLGHPAHPVRGRGARAPALWFVDPISALQAWLPTRCAGVYVVLFATTVWALHVRRRGTGAHSVSPVIDVCSWFVFITLTIVSPLLVHVSRAIYSPILG
jgi:hypothetical protein